MNEGQGPVSAGPFYGFFMDLTKDSIVAAINENIYGGQNTVTVDTGIRAIRAGLRWLSRQAKWRCLHVKELSGAALASGTKTIAHPANFRLFDKIVLNDGTYDGSPLLLTMQQDILENREDETSASYGEPTHYAPKGAFWHIKPTADGAYTPKISYWRYHPDVTGEDDYKNTDPLEFGENFEEALNLICTSYHLRHKKRLVEARYYMQAAREELAALADEVDFEARFVKTRELG